jgi:hypothetical protein
MHAQPGVARTRTAVRRLTADGRSRDHRFFTIMGVLAALIVFVGFAPTYYLRRAFGGPELTGLVHLHGVVSTGWILLYIVQSSLVSAGRTGLHRRLGAVGALLAAVLLVIGYLTAIEAARHGVAPPRQGVSPLGFLAVPLSALLAFLLLAGAGLWFRRRADTHKRLMLLATIAILVPALARMEFLAGGGPVAVIGGSVLLVGACLGYDRITHGRMHPAFVWGGGLLLLSLPLRFALARTGAWQSVAVWLVR